MDNQAKAAVVVKLPSGSLQAIDELAETLTCTRSQVVAMLVRFGERRVEQLRSERSVFRLEAWQLMSSEVRAIAILIAATERAKAEIW